MDKAELRLLFKAKLALLTDGERAERSRRTVEGIASTDGYKNAEKLFLYLPLRSEPDISELAEIARSEGKTVAFPKISDGVMKYFSSGRFVKSKIGIYEPEDGEEVFADEKTAVIVPALAYRRDGYRLGRGGGWFDRFLAGFRGVSIGAAFSLSIVENDAFDAEKHDIPVDIVVTEAGIYGRPERTVL